MSKIANHILTPRDIYQLLKYSWARAGLRDLNGLLLLVILSLIFRLYLNLSLENSLFLLFICTLFYWRIDARLSIGLALVGLISIPVLLILFNQNIYLLGEYRAEQAAIWVYYFLSIGVVKQIWEYASENKKSKTKKQNESYKKIIVTDIRSPKF